ncbi:hypothetical protein PCAU_5990 [Pseudomonas chlororaphis subsp. aurantiaca]|uniref:hypothetical protein n=1 Tax=Pseudomonas chlororaphis TaxID=587753 RepID=UPI000865C91A|nr:hypothetical protein [Pseudomonas chlororaphis]BAV78199.1 hypothetical protein PCAU_5990 [Pseudomonas chlororaphis subsp. aurantiaca]
MNFHAAFFKTFMVHALACLLFMSGAAYAEENNISKGFDAITYEEALEKFNEKHSDENYRCQYSLSGVNENSPLTAVEIEDFIYLKKNGSIIELAGKDRDENAGSYSSRDGVLNMSYKVLKKYNFSEYQESDDRDVEFKFSYQGKVEVVKMHGIRCGI